MLFEIHLCCPVCGSHEFDQEEKGVWICPDCQWQGTTDEMEIQVFKA